MRRARGFTLIEMVVVIAVLGLLMTMMVGITRALVSQQRYATTRARMANIDSALIVFVQQNKRLPCPADGTIASTIGTGGGEITNGLTGASRACTDASHPNAQKDGVVPWRTLGLTASDIEDGWGGRFTYRVGPELVWDSAMDFSSCDPAGTGVINTTTPPISAASVPPWCIAAGTGTYQCNSANLGYCTPPNTALTQTNTKGLVVENLSGAILMDPRSTAVPPVSTGAAYAVISHGPEGGGAYSGNGTLQSSSVAAGTMEAKNFANIAYASPAGLPAAPTWFVVDDATNAATTTSHFDDIISRPSIFAVATKAGLGPRAH